MPSALKFKSTSVPRHKDEQARLRVIQGPDVGVVFILTGARSYVGRGEENDVVVADLKASRQHAEFVASPNGWMVKDLASANGITHNGKQVKSAVLKTKDIVTLGETTFEFLPADAPTSMIVAPAQDLMQIQSQQAAYNTQREKIRSIGMPKGKIQKSLANTKKNSPVDPKILVLAVAGIVVYFWLSADQTPTNKSTTPVMKTTAELEQRDLASLLPGANGIVAYNRTAEMFYREGFREFREGNFIRAKAQFELALQIAPDHKLSRLYMENCNKAIDDEVKAQLSYGKKSFAAGKLREARGHFEAVIRLLYFDQSNPSFTEAKEQLDEVKKSIEGQG